MIVIARKRTKNKKNKQTKNKKTSLSRLYRGLTLSLSGATSLLICAFELFDKSLFTLTRS